MQESIFAVKSPVDRFGLASFRERVQEMVSPGRYQHILRVVQLTQSIAVGNGFEADERRAAVLAALLHDCARDLSAPELIALAPPRNELERSHPLSLHGRAGRKLAEQWLVSDERVLNAIEGHVYGVAMDDRVGMSVYVADVSEPGRGVNSEIREMAICDLERAYRLAVDSKVSYLRSRGKLVHPETLKVYDEIHNA